MEDIVLIFDFDSTFTQVEALDVLGEIVLSGADKEKKLNQIASITNKGMSGELSFRESLEMRMKILSGTKDDITELVSRLKSKVSVSIQANKEFFLKNANNIFIVSSGFKEFIEPVVADFGISPSHVYANSFVWKNNAIAGFETQNPLSGDNGKPLVVQKIGLNKKVIVIGDGYTDYEIKKAGAADLFVAFTENISRSSVTEKADFIASNFIDFLNFITHGTKTVIPQA